MILVCALAALVISSSAPQDAPTLSQIQEIAKGNREDRFEQIVRFAERAKSDEEAAAGIDVLKNSTSALDDALKSVYALPEKEREAKYAEIMRPFRAHQKLIFIDSNLAAKTVRELYGAAPAERVRILKGLALKAGDDWPLQDDECYWGPKCGTYDHTNEYLIEWAARRYLNETIEALGQKVGWPGRRQMMIGLNGYYEPLTDPRLKPIFLRLTADPNTLVRGEAILSLQHYPGADTEAALRVALRDRAADTRAKAMSTAEQLKLKSFIPVAILLTRDPSSYVGEQSLDFLAAIGTPEAKARVIECLGDYRMARYAIPAIEKGKIQEASPYLVKLLDDRKIDDWIRRNALDVLAGIDPAAGADQALKVLKSNDEELMLTAISLAQQMRLQSARPFLLKLVKSKDEYTRDSALDALRELDKSQ